MSCRDCVKKGELIPTLILNWHLQQDQLKQNKKITSFMAILPIFAEVAKNTHRICNQIKSLKNFFSTFMLLGVMLYRLRAKEGILIKTASQRENFHPTNPDADLS